jgi:branched-chain amino acid transport system substrate-binding protein
VFASAKSRLTRAALIATTLALSTAVAACGSGQPGTGGEGTGSTDGLTSTVNLLSVRDETGVTAYAGLGAVRGSEVAVNEINSSGFLGQTKLAMDRRDAAGTAQTAASLASEGIASRRYSAILGPILAVESRAIAPIAEKSQVPVVFTQSNSEGVLIGNFTFRATAPFPKYYDVMGEQLQKKGVTSIGVLFDAQTASYVETATKVIPEWEQKYGIRVVASKEVQSNTQDFTASISSLLAEKPGAVAVYLLGAQHGTFLKQLRQAGFTGPVIAANGAGNGNLAGAGADGVGVSWPTAFDPSAPDASTQDFVKAYRQMFPDKMPNIYEAEGYDAVWWIARALKAADSADPVAVQKGLVEVAATGFDGAQGALRFEGNDLRATPKIVQWDGAAEVPSP